MSGKFHFNSFYKDADRWNGNGHDDGGNNVDEDTDFNKDLEDQLSEHHL